MRRCKYIEISIDIGYEKIFVLVLAQPQSQNHRGGKHLLVLNPNLKNKPKLSNPTAAFPKANTKTKQNKRQTLKTLLPTPKAKKQMKTNPVLASPKL